MHENKQWFSWVRHLEDDEEKERDAEKKKLKQEAALFKSNWAEVQARQTRLKQKENENRQAEFLNKAWEERHSLNTESTDEDYDPIDDIVEIWTSAGLGSHVDALTCIVPNFQRRLL